LLIEESRTNVLLNSLIDGTDLATQSVTVTAAAHTLSFYGDGSVALSGVHTATISGLGAYPTRTTLTFTPTAGALTLTVTGDVKFANLELGAFPTSFIPTDGTTKTRNSDLATLTGTNFSDWFSASEGTFLAEVVYGNLSATKHAFEANDGGIQNFIRLVFDSSNARSQVSDINVLQANLLLGTPSSPAKLVGAYKLNNFVGSVNGGAVVTDTAGTIPICNRAYIGSRNGNDRFWNGVIGKIYYWPQRLTNAEVQAFSK
jgi:hypothetical protein